MRLLAICAMVSFVALPPALARDDDMAALMRSLGGGGLTGKKLKRAIEKADAYPLGSKDNPVRVDGPLGERAYLARLRCADGKAPDFNRDGSVGSSPYGYIMDLYSVRCREVPVVSVYMDMYHSDAAESRPVPGFTIDNSNIV